MIKKTLFTIDYYEKEDFINQSEIDKLSASIDRNSLTDYDYIPGNAKTSIGVSQNQFLDFHKDLEERIVKEIIHEYLNTYQVNVLSEVEYCFESATNLFREMNEISKPLVLTDEVFDENNRDTRDDPFKGTSIEGKD